ncbi:MAG: hypothetical protein KC457_11215 [Myxococcales bacterium]|nr:hypothetical protein [Myxococcales bacterium]
MGSRLERVLFTILVLALLLTHMLGFGQGDRPLLLGWIPLDLAYRLAWIGVAALAVFWMTGRLWPNRE